METQDAPSASPSPPRQGIHLLGEWYGCNFSASALNEAETLRMVCLFVTNNSGLQIVGDVFHQFKPQGITGTVLLAESHLAIHTRPEENFATLDVYICNYQDDNTQKALKLYTILKTYFQPARENFLKLPRGNQHAES